MDLGFLNDISLVKTEATRTRSASIDTTPADGADLRLFADGRMFPAAQTAEDNSLEYVAKGEEVGNGFDIVDTAHFPNYPKGQPRLVMIALVAKDLPKVDLFGQVGYNPDNTPKTSVLTQGSSTAGKWLIELLKEVYDIEFAEGQKYIDLKINTAFAQTTPNNIYQFPKRVTRGENKGEMTYQRRTDTALWPLTVIETEDSEVTSESTAEPAEQTLTDNNPPDMEMDIESGTDPMITDENEIVDNSNTETL